MLPAYRKQEMLPGLAHQLSVNEGFAPNTFRKTGRVFNAEALNTFLKTNNLLYIIRAHEVKLQGFQVSLIGKLK